jgi:hypothetical protein
VLRSYKAWSLTSYNDNSILNPQDWLLQQWLEVWAVQNKQPYDVFEIPPVLTPAQRKEIEVELKKYKYVVATEPWKNAWIIGDKTTGTLVTPDESTKYQQQFSSQIKQKGWMK